MPPQRGNRTFFQSARSCVGSAAVGTLIRRQEGRQIVFPQDGVHIMDVIDSVAECHDERTITGDPCVQRSHAVQSQCFLHFLQLELRSQADPKDDKVKEAKRRLRMYQSLWK